MYVLFSCRFMYVLYACMHACMYNLCMSCFHVDSFAPNNTGAPSITISLYGTVQGFVNNSIQCTARTDSDLQNIDEIAFYWIGPDNNVMVNNSRITITSPVSNGMNEYTSSLQFYHIIEEDEGTYVCSVTALTKTSAVLFTVNMQGTLIKLDTICA